MWKMMFGAPKDREIIVIDRAGFPYRAKWMVQEKNWRREEVHGYVAGDRVIDAVLWCEVPTDYDLSVGKTA